MKKGHSNQSNKPNKLTYESDGKMGKKEKKDTQEQDKGFFNTTQSSE